MALTSALEYFTSWFMEAVFHMRWWDYSRKKIQLNGRICLQNSLLFGLACVDRKSTRLNSSHYQQSRMPSSA